MQSLQWYVSRLGRMSLAELAWRARQAARGRVLRWTGGGMGRVPPADLRYGWAGNGGVGAEAAVKMANGAASDGPLPDLARGSSRESSGESSLSAARRDPDAGHGPAPFVHPRQRLDPLPYVRQAQRILRGEFDVFDLRGCRLYDRPEAAAKAGSAGRDAAPERRPRPAGRAKGEAGAGLAEAPEAGSDAGARTGTGARSNEDGRGGPQWNRDPLTGRHAPMRHASALDHRDESLVGNIKYLWEPNRHLHLPQLAQAYTLTGELRYALAIRDHVESWIDQCPPGYGPNWSSALELAIRLVNWSIAWQLIGGADSALFDGAAGQAFRGRWLRSVYQQVRAVRGMLSRHSSANNHLIGECAGVWIASLTWGYWPQMRRWGNDCRDLLEREALRQNAEDGGNREQAFAYQQFVLDFLLLSGLAGRAAGRDFSRAYWQRIEAMLDFLAAMMNVGGQVPMVGDADDGYVVQLSPEADFDNYRSLLATGAVMFGRPDLAAKAGGVDDKTRWLLGEAALGHEPPVRRTSAAHGGVGDGDGHGTVGERAGDPHETARRRAEAARTRRAFPDSGYYLMGEAFGSLEEIRLLVDAGPLGYLSLAAHGHADALAILLSVGGREVLVDPGTYAYHTDAPWRRYFRSTRAHNTVEVDGRDQSQQSGNFMWSRHARARCLRFDASDERQHFIGEHDGYEVLGDPVTHRREIVHEPGSGCFDIIDTLACAAGHEVVRYWHLAEELMPEVEGPSLRVRAGAWLVRIEALEPVDLVRRVRGGDAREGGWVSRRFGYKVPATSVAWHSRIVGTTSLRTRIRCEPAVASATRGAGRGEAVVSEAGAVSEAGGERGWRGGTGRDEWSIRGSGIRRSTV